MQLLVSNEQNKININDNQIEMLKKVLEIALDDNNIKNKKISLNEDAEISLLFVDDERIHNLNKEYRNIDRATDVLSFALYDEIDEEINFDFAPDNLLGDIIISLETAKRQAEEYGHSFEREICFLIVHGCLHLLGHDHIEEEERKEMRKKEEAILYNAGLNR